MKDPAQTLVIEEPPERRRSRKRRRKSQWTYDEDLRGRPVSRVAFLLLRLPRVLVAVAVVVVVAQVSRVYK